MAALASVTFPFLSLTTPAKRAGLAFSRRLFVSVQLFFFLVVVFLRRLIVFLFMTK